MAVDRPADPVVSPADTIRQTLEAVAGDADVLIGLGFNYNTRPALDSLAALLAVGERDRQQIARLTEALADLVQPFQWLCEHQPQAMREMPTAHVEAFKRAGETLAAVLAGEEDARP